MANKKNAKPKNGERPDKQARNPAPPPPTNEENEVLEALYQQLAQDLEHELTAADEADLCDSFEAAFAREFGAAGLLGTKKAPALLGDWPAFKSVGQREAEKRRALAAYGMKQTPARYDSAPGYGQADEHTEALRPRVVLAGSDPATSASLCAMLEDCGMVAELLDTCEDAVQHILAAKEDANPVSLALLAPNSEEPAPLPWDGAARDRHACICAATRILRNAGIGHTKLPIIALTPHCPMESASAMRRAGVQAVLAAPAYWGNLVHALNRWLPHSIVDEGAATRVPVKLDADPIPAMPVAGPVTAPDPADNAPEFDDELERQWRQTRSDALMELEEALRGTLCAEGHERELVHSMRRLANIAGLFGEVRLGERAESLQQALYHGRCEQECRKLARTVLAEAGAKLIEHKQTAAP
jgi:CheY-like chemotaxis protein